MGERSSNVTVAIKGRRLLISGRPYKGAGMSTGKTKRNQELVKKHRQLFKEQPEFLRPESDSLEQPYAGEVVDTLTTYSVYGEPTPEE